MLVLLLLHLFYSIQCNNKSTSREDTEKKEETDLGLDLELDRNVRNKIETYGKRKGIRIRNNLGVCVEQNQEQPVLNIHKYL